VAGRAGDGAAGTRPATGIRPAWFAAAAQLVVLTVGSVGYGFHRDELYFRMLAPAWGHVDQPPLTPWLARTFTSVVADEAWALRIPATVASAASVVLVAMITRELGGDRRAVAFAAWGAAFAGLPLALGHVLLTSTIDLPLTLGVVLTVVLALRTSPQWWLAAGAVAGLATWNRLLVPLVWFGVLLGLAVLGPRAPLRTRWPWLGAVVAAVVGAPNLVYQWQHDWPQLAMGAALSDNNAADVRADLPLILLIAIGPPLVVVWLAGAWEAWRLPRARWLLAPAVVLLVFTVVAAAQPHYPLVMLAVLYAVGCLPLSRWVGDHAWRRAVVVGLIALNAVVSVVIALPVVPVTAVGATPLPDLSTLVADQVGWPRYVRQVASVAARADDPGAVVITSNYGEAGAVARYGPALGLPAPYSGQNDLGTRPGPPEGTRTVVFVGWQLAAASPLFATCTVQARLDNGVGVDNEEQGAPVAICRDPVLPWSRLWPQLAHLD
jgi:4-amino-4-deoxy-L-arabinose transferase-like glycosyltransferase